MTLEEFITEQKTFGIKKARARFRVKLAFPEITDKEFEKTWKLIK